MEVVHGLINLINIELAMNLLHGFARLVHHRKGLPIDIRCLNRIYLLFESSYLSGRLVQCMFVLLFAPKSSPCGYCRLLANLQALGLHL